MYSRFVQNKAKKHPQGTLGVSFNPSIEPLDDAEGGGALLWLGSHEKATKVVYFLHGGGYIVPMARGHLYWCWDLYMKPSAAAGIDVACAILEYTLAPEAIFPNQLRQASEGLRAIIKHGFSPEDIIVGGDSAGANLTMQLLLHIHHPHPEVHPVKIQSPLKAAFLASAYLTHYAASLPSYNRNINFDLAPSRQRLIHVQAQVAGVKEPTAEQMQARYWWGSPLDADPRNFAGLGDVVRHIYFTCGGIEILVDHTTKMVQLLEQNAPEVQLVVEVGPNEPHDGVLLDKLSGQLYGPCSTRVKEWFARLLQGDFDAVSRQQQKRLEESYESITSA